MEDENKEEVTETQEPEQEVVDTQEEGQELSNEDLNQKVKDSKYDWASLTPIIVFGIILVGLVIALLVIIYA